MFKKYNKSLHVLIKSVTKSPTVWFTVYKPGSFDTYDNNDLSSYQLRQWHNVYYNNYVLGESNILKTVGNLPILNGNAHFWHNKKNSFVMCLHGHFCQLTFERYYLSKGKLPCKHALLQILNLFWQLRLHENAHLLHTSIWKSNLAIYGMIEIFSCKFIWMKLHILT